MTNNKNNFIDSALQYLSLGFSVIPVGRDKKPLIDWKKYQSERAIEEKIREWRDRWPEANLGIVTGAISNIVVVDIEKDGKIEGWPATVTAKTGGGGFHLYYKHPNKNVANGVRIRELTDFRGDGGYIVAPPSVHASGNQYEWIVSPSDAKFADFPEEFLKTHGTEKRPIQSFFNGVPEGMRNMSATSIIGKLLTGIEPSLWNIAAWPAFKEWNTKNQPPLSENELKSVFESIRQREIDKQLTKMDQRELSSPLSIADVLNMTFEQQLFLVEKLIPEGGISAISGQSESGKSWIILYLAQCISRGIPVFGKYAVTQGPVLIIDEEGGAIEFQRRMRMLGFKTEDKIFLYSEKGFKVDNANDLKLLIEEAKARNVKVVIFDPFSAIHSRTENSAEEMQKVMELLGEFNKNNMTVIFIHHHRKEHFANKNPKATTGLRGSSLLFTKVNAHLAVSKEKEEENKVFIMIEPTKLRRGRKEKPFNIELNIDEITSMAEFNFLGETKNNIIQKEKAKELIIPLLERSGEPLQTEEIIDAIKGEIGKTSVECALKELKREGIISRGRIDDGGGKFFNWLNEDTETLEQEQLLPS